ncbi:hypothetical protein [uncultured Desulfobacter sp.]|uniref:hypothetical protein n=1 Tax=uncultured Desulfobacter sp. TaxID=240139 RepID=UPI0029F50331|nr:hypothetical protein [uncultured Desulfobacter sp.]
MKESNNTEMEFQLKKLVTKYSDLFQYHQWPSEHERWVELIFALIARISKMPETDIRDTISFLDSLDLLDIEELSNIPEVENDVDYNYHHARWTIESLSESGFTVEESKRSLRIMHEAARNLSEHHDGKIQKYLRKYGQKMIDELSENFTFSAMKDEDVKYAFGYWLQNVLNLPIILKAESVNKFCKNIDVTCNELTEKADDLDINLALVDDLVDQYIADITDKT